MDDSDFDSELWMSEEESDYNEEYEIERQAPRRPGDATLFTLELTPDAEALTSSLKMFTLAADLGRSSERWRPNSMLGGRRDRPSTSALLPKLSFTEHWTKPQKLLLPSVYDFTFLSHRSTRIKDANISFEFKAKRGSTSLGPTVINVAPYAKHIMMRTTETVTRTVGGDFGVQAGTVVTGDAGIHGEKSVEKITTHAAEVVGNNPADEWSNRFLAQWSLSENDSQMSGIVSLFRSCILLTRDNDEEFYLYPTVEVTPDLKTQLKTPLWGFRRADDPIKIVPTSTEVNRLEGNDISSSNLGSGLSNLWDCTFYATFENAMKASRPSVTTGEGAEKMTTVKETKLAVP
ncbi:hypothetical protein F4809DRAFT_642243 [Biscogniauxia mediterranea]|nr:hypothetical protein F4809DRAFT_642243 [Biscogniauxia mediterranea]